jgi:hypothetical protein
MPSAASVLAPTAASPGMTQRLPSWDAGVLADPAGVGAAVGVGACGWVTGGAGGAGAGVVVGVGAAPDHPVATRKCQE